MFKQLNVLVFAMALAGCALPDSMRRGAEIPPASEESKVTDPELSAPPPPANARTVEQFDTTTEAQRIAASSGSVDGALLGSAVATLGNPTLGGFWLETSLVTGSIAGRVVSSTTGQSAEVELIPASDGVTRLSLAAMRLLGVPLTDLAEVKIYEAK